MGLLVIFLMSFIDYSKPDVTSFAPPLIGLIGISAGFYFAIMSIIDKESRELFKAALLTIKKF